MEQVYSEIFVVLIERAVNRMVPILGGIVCWFYKLTVGRVVRTLIVRVLPQNWGAELSEQLDSAAREDPVGQSQKLEVWLRTARASLIDGSRTFKAIAMFPAYTAISFLLLLFSLSLIGLGWTLGPMST